MDYQKERKRNSIGRRAAKGLAIAVLGVYVGGCSVNKVLYYPNTPPILSELYTPKKPSIDSRIEVTPLGEPTDEGLEKKCIFFGLFKSLGIKVTCSEGNIVPGGAGDSGEDRGVSGASSSGGPDKGPGDNGNGATGGVESHGDPSDNDGAKAR